MKITDFILLWVADLAALEYTPLQMAHVMGLEDPLRFISEFQIPDSRLRMTYESARALAICEEDKILRKLLLETGDPFLKDRIEKKKIQAQQRETKYLSLLELQRMKKESEVFPAESETIDN